MKSESWCPARGGERCRTCPIMTECDCATSYFKMKKELDYGPENNDGVN